ncbi:MAG TPA: hypothetical protein VE684_15075 [Crenalkalicoccus sp.]|jgi:hypothetical protein|nr:hypothetical protein [Crenalkalicoccus sp.]
MMAPVLPFTFGIALAPRAAARNWPLVEALLDLTLASVRAQTDQDFRVDIAGHDRPRTTMDGDPRLSFHEASWPVQEPGPHNDDGGRKKHAISDLVLGRGGGLLMILDADDWVDIRLVETARAMVAAGRDCVGAVITTGFATDFRSLRAVPVPHPRVYRGWFHRVCGSSIIARLRPGEADPLRRDPLDLLRSHHRWIEAAREHRVQLVRLPVAGNYVINTSENHSEIHGPHAAWRWFTARVNREGRMMDAALASRFGLGLDRIHAASARFRAPAAATLAG